VNHLVICQQDFHTLSSFTLYWPAICSDRINTAKHLERLETSYLLKCYTFIKFLIVLTSGRILSKNSMIFNGLNAKCSMEACVQVLQLKIVFKTIKVPQNHKFTADIS
jgi:hypothetical protein